MIPPSWSRSQANISLLFSEVPFARRPAAAAAAGFGAIECWWPFADASPSDREVDAFVTTVEDAGVTLRGLNFFAGDMPNGERGVLSHPGRRPEFDDSLAIAMDIGSRLGVTGFNALYGNRLAGLSPVEQDEVALDVLTTATERADELGATILLEPISGIAAYPLKLTADALAVVDVVTERAAKGRIGLLADLFHLTVNGDDVLRTVTRYVDRIAHVQVADAPGRHEPGTGSARILELVEALTDAGYAGAIGLEYVPVADTMTGLDWLRQLVPTFGRDPEMTR